MSRGTVLVPEFQLLSVCTNDLSSCKTKQPIREKDTQKQEKTTETENTEIRRRQKSKKANKRGDSFFLSPLTGKRP